MPSANATGARAIRQEREQRESTARAAAENRNRRPAVQERWTVQGHSVSIVVERCPFGHITKSGRMYTCGDCRERVGPCRCQLFRHVMAQQGDGRHKVPTRIMGAGYRVTYHPEKLAR